MQGAKRIVVYRDGDPGDGARIDHVATEKPTLKTMRPVDNPTNREMRRRRDLIYVMLKREGLSWREIALTCKFAARSRRQIRKRSGQAMAYYAGGQAVG